MSLYCNLAFHFWNNVLECADQPALRVNLATKTLAQGELAQPDPARVDTTPAAAWFSWGELGRLVAGQLGRCAGVASRIESRIESPISQGDHVATSLRNSLDWIVVDLACQSLGAVHVALDHREPEQRLKRLVEHSQAKIWSREQWSGDALGAIKNELAAISGDESEVVAAAREFRQRAAELPLDTPAQMIYTSGTSGEPKGVMLSHGNLVTNARAKLAAAPQFDWDLRCNVLPFSHAYARTCELSTWLLTRGRLALMDDWADFRAQAAELRPTLVNLVPYLAEKLADALEKDPRILGYRMRLLQVGGAALSDELFNRLEHFGLPPLQGYGLTEAAPVVCSNQAGKQRPGTVGPAAMGTEWRIDENGVLWTRGPHVMLGYWSDPAGTREAIQNGWLCTGDLVELSSDRDLRIVGRRSSQIVLSTGYVVSPEPIERELLQHPWIDQVVVTGEGQSHLTAHIWPNFAAIPAEYFEDGFQAHKKTLAALRQAFLLNSLRDREVSGVLKCYPNLVIQFLPNPLSVDAGTLSVKGTTRRG